MLIQALCHQRDPCTAAHAAVPHLVDIVAEHPAAEGAAVLDLVGGIVVWAHHGPAVEPWLAPAYEQALDRAAQLLERWLDEDAPVDVRRILATHAAASGEIPLGRVLSELFDVEVDAACTCGSRVVMGLEDDGFALDPFRWVSRAQQPNVRHQRWFDWAVARGEQPLANQIQALDSIIACPECGHELGVIDAVLNAYP